MSTNTADKKKDESAFTEPYSGADDPTDGRKPYECISKYPASVKHEIYAEMVFLFVVLIASLVLVFATWKGWVSLFLASSVEESITLRKYSYYASAGMLGGIIFGMKYFYRAVARGLWHQDRRSWRLMSPAIAPVIAVMVGVMIDASVMATPHKPTSGYYAVSIGFLAGYFADEAVGKMYEIATVIFGKSSMAKNVIEKSPIMKSGNEKT